MVSRGVQGEGDTGSMYAEIEDLLTSEMRRVWEENKTSTRKKPQVENLLLLP
jgi:hypothetical protein